ncbi:MAG: hypothetical protein JKX98_08960 [Alcanivoracaceae bacterium]|nr:hypothetical protein [Alcanivoracaceae bacterium]
MKFLFTILVIFQINICSAGTFPSLIVSTTNPSSNDPLNHIVTPNRTQGFFLWRQLILSNGISFEESHININGNEIDVFVLNDFGGPLWSPPPPSGAYFSVVEFNALNAGTYLLNYYSVPLGTTFPPSNADAPMFFVESIQFNVLGVSSIDSSSKVSLSILMMLMVLSFWWYGKNKEI